MLTAAFQPRDKVQDLLKKSYTHSMRTTKHMVCQNTNCTQLKILFGSLLPEEPIAGHQSDDQTATIMP